MKTMEKGEEIERRREIAGNDPTVAGRFERQVQSSPTATALVYGEQCISYAELNERANRLAWLLIARGAGPEDVVAIAIPRSPEMIVALLAVLKAGAAYLPLDTEDAVNRVAYMLADAAPVCVLTTSSLCAKIPSHYETIVLDVFPARALLSQCAAKNPGRAPGTTLDSMIYVMYTSGSTGKPKGVVVLHRGVMGLVCNPDYVQLDTNQVMLQLAPASFDASTFEIWGALLNGARLLLFPATIPTLQQIEKILKGSHITTLFLTTGLFHLMVNHCLSAMAGVKQLLTGGEVLGVAQAKKVLTELPGCRLINVYGPTEGTTFSSCHTILLSDCFNSSVPIGRPLADRAAYILDPAMQPVAGGAVGELYIAGAGLARGYLNKPQWTAERFLPNPFAEPGSVMYCTGDLASSRPDGTLLFHGRVDHQVKLRGFRIELAEIEAVLRSDPAVQDAAVVLREDIPGDKRIVAYVVASQEQAGTPAQIRGRLSGQLAQYMMPSHFVPLPAIPLTANGKLDRQSLPAPKEASGETEGPYTPPQTQAEEELCRIWQTVLCAERIGREDHFFTLGGQSLQAMQVMARVLDLFHVEIPIKVLFEAPVLSAFASSIEALRQTSPPEPVSVIPIVARDCLLPLSLGEQGLWGMNHDCPQQLTLNVPIVARIAGPLQISALEESFDALLRRHEVLRTTYPIEDGQPVRVIAPPERFRFTVESIAPVPAHGMDEEADRLALEELKRLFDLSRGPLIRVRLLKLRDEDHLLMITLHHIIADGWSLQVLCRELSQAYTALVHGRPVELAPLPIQYADYAAWKRGHLQEDSVKRRLISYWRRQLSGLPGPLVLPVDKPRLEQSLAPIAVASFRICRDQTAKLRRLHSQEDVTTYMTLLAVYQMLLHRLTGVDDIVTAAPVSERNRHETEGLIGLFVNVIVLRTDLSGDPTFQELLRRVRAVSRDGYAHQEMPTVALAKVLASAADSTPRAPLQFFFNLDVVVSEFPLPGLQVVVAPPGRELEARWDMSVDVSEDEDTLHFSVGYKQGWCSPQWMAAFLDQFKALIAQVLEDPAKRISAYTMHMPGVPQNLIS